ncbi:MAG TPA: cation:dicarboxylase symporter family transporter, partial [Polyangiaceae bacterium]|nr:cation:dicarboxylase symporter family transporter [Polyangiaceae bacterium]
MPKLKLHFQIFIALALAVLVGLTVPAEAGFLGASVAGVCEFFGSLFLRALKMLVVPLILSSIIAAVAGMGSGVQLGRMGLKTGGYYALTALLAIVVGLGLVANVQPGGG